MQGVAASATGTLTAEDQESDGTQPGPAHSTSTQPYGTSCSPWDIVARQT